jgi:hypothetical protein
MSSFLMLVLMNKMLETGKGNLLEIWPNLEVYHGGVTLNRNHEQ